MEPKQGTQYRCTLREKAGAWSIFHSYGNGKPRSKRCTYCGAPFIIESGWYGAFTWTGDGNYPPEKALKLFTRESDAHRYADKRAHDNVVVRWTR